MTLTAQWFITDKMGTPIESTPQLHAVITGGRHRANGFPSVVVHFVACDGIDYKVSFFTKKIGKAVITGVSDVGRAMLVLGQLAATISTRIGASMRVGSPSVNNFVMCFDVGHHIDLMKLKDRVGLPACYCPWTFPGCTIKVCMDPRVPRKLAEAGKKVCLNVAYSGKVIVTGSRFRSVIRSLMDFYVPMLRMCRVSPEESKEIQSKISERRKMMHTNPAAAAAAGDTRDLL